MIGIVIVAGLTVLAAASSLWGTYDDYRDLKSGRPSFETLISRTGIGDHDRFVDLLGPPDDDGRFRLSPDERKALPTALWVRLLDHSAVDGLSILLAAIAPFLWARQSLAAVACVLIPAIVQGLGYMMAVITVSRSDVLRNSSDHSRTGSPDIQA